MEEQRDLPVLRVEDAMKPPSMPILEGDELVSAAWHRVQNATQTSLFVRHANGEWSAIPKAELAGLALHNSSVNISAVLDSRATLPRLHPDHPLDVALRYVQDYPILPVVHRADTRKLEGVIRMEDVLEAYRKNL